ncbi:KTSC domain-containing protein [Sphingobium sp. PNB]|uniref:KTSC domain-containing protein n=1 Tax=Sphingobium sp. PNB TaxID=863934 RepID=UPI001CA39916|nr:KTSC domain-containing protein [Sphingobium sp. PNB]
MAWHEFPAFESSNIASIRYDDETSTLEVTFLNGGTYQYFDVPEHVSKEFEQQESKGKYLASNIKGHYRYGKI